MAYLQGIKGFLLEEIPLNIKAKNWLLIEARASRVRAPSTRWVVLAGNQAPTVVAGQRLTSYHNA